MAANPMVEVIQILRKTMVLPEEAGLTDAHLLAEYFKRQDPAALASLVKRHAPMVWGVCRRELGNHHDAEDAFQATFLVFVRKGASIRNKELLANWLYGVARQTALKARTTAARRKGREKQVMDMPDAAESQEKLVNDLQPLLDQELGRLPEKYRAVVVLCDLEGKTRHEAASCLGCAEGTVASRLARARAMLAKRLARHGLPTSGGVVTALLAPQAASASIPASLVHSTINAAELFAGGQAAGAIPLKVVALAEGVLKMMLLKKLTSAAFATVLASLLGLVISAWVMGQTKTDTEARIENAAVLHKNDQRDKKDDDTGKKAIAADLQKLDGTWRLVALEVGGKAVDPETWGRNVRREFSGTTVRFHSGARVTKSEISIDPSKTPKWMDETWVTGARTHGIYELKGNTLRLFMTPAEEQRPTEFKTRDGTKEAIATYERVDAAALPKPLPDEVVRAWKDAGFTVGLMWVDRSGGIRHNFGSAKEQPGGEIPGFQLDKWRDGVLSKLPDPGMPFGLFLNGTKVRDAGLKELAGLKSLQSLNLGGTQVTGAGLKELAGLKSLQTLILTKVTDAGLKELAGLTNLQALHIGGSQEVTDAGLKELAGLKSLRTLDLYGTQVTGSGLKELTGLTNLQWLNLWHSPGDGRGTEGGGRAEELADAETCRHPGHGRGIEGIGRAEEPGGAESLHHQGDGRGAEGARRAEEPADAEPSGDQGDRRGSRRAAKGLARVHDHR